MPLVTGTVDISYLPAPANPQTVEANPVSPPVAGALTSNSMPSDPARYAGLSGTLTLNGQSVVLNTTMLKAAGIRDAINALNTTGITASISPQGRLKLSTASGTAITIAGTAALLTALGLTAGTTAV